MRVKTVQKEYIDTTCSEHNERAEGESFFALSVLFEVRGREAEGAKGRKKKRRFTICSPTLFDPTAGGSSET